MLDKENDEPVIGPNYKYKLKGTTYVDDDIKQINKKSNLLKKIMITGTELNQKEYKTNKLIKNAIKSQNIAPFWLIVSTLNFGDLQILFSMQSRNTQVEILQHFQSLRNSVEKSIQKFNGNLEIIRKLRNTVDHYLPIFPELLCQDIKRNIPESKIVKVIELLQEQKSCSLEEQGNKIEKIIIENDNFFGIPVTGFNKTKIMFLNTIIDILNK